MALIVKVVCTYALNGYYGRVEGVGGSATWDGAILLLCGQFTLVACMSFVMPGQKIAASAFAVIAEVPWWCTPHWHRNSLVLWDTNSSPLSDESLSGMP